MIICETENGIGLSWRENNNVNYNEISHNEFRPYFFVKKKNNLPLTAHIKDNLGKLQVNLTYEEGDYHNLQGQELVKVMWRPNNPKYARKLQATFGETYEADVRYHYRYAVDEIKEMPEYEMRKWFWDMEWVSDDHDYEGAITCIVVYDNFGEKLPKDPMDMFNPDYETKEFGKYTTYVWFPHYQATDEERENLPLFTYPSRNEGVRIFESEKEMLNAFLEDVEEMNPDMLISWFGWKFDLPKLIERMVFNGLDARRLSPFNEVSGVYWKNKPKMSKKVQNYSPIYQPIKGRICLALEHVFERQWNDAQRGTLPSLALDYVAETLLGQKKLVSEKFPDKNEFFAKGWLEDTVTYLEYAQKDVELLVKIDEENFTTDAVLSLQRLLKAPFDACFYASNMASIYFMRNASWKAPTGSKEERVDYEGAMVYVPLSENTNGLHLGVAAFDFAGLYPSMMIARNISWETKSAEPTEFAVNILTPKDFSEVTKTHMLYYKTDELGLLPRAVLELKELRNEYKRNMKNASDKSEYNKWNNNQLAVKRLMASFYGIIAYQGFGWADVDLAASITASAREAIREAAFIVRGLE